MIEKALSGMEFPEQCKHVIDIKEMPKWDKRLGKVYTCTKCGVKVFSNKAYAPMPGERIRMSKKERRRRKNG